MNRIKYIFFTLTLAVLSACTDKLDTWIDDDGLISVGDEVQFSVQVPEAATRSAKSDYETLISKFEHVQDDYVFDVEMFEEGNATRLASAKYNPTKKTVDNVTTYDEFGTLTEKDNYLYWPSNVKKYAFHAVSSNSSASVESDQTTEAKFFKQDRIEGYGYVPGWDDEAGGAIRNLDGLNYLTSKEWYAANKAWGLPKVGATEAECVEFWKKVPLYMRHKRSRITVLLKAGEGVERDQVKFDEYTSQHIKTEIYSYDDAGNPTVVDPLLGSYTCLYRSPDAAPEEDIVSACYDAIVDPHNYAEGDNMTEQKILAINLSGMKFSFYAANDRAYSSAPDAENEDVKTRYNLTEGKHLILTVTLSTDTRKILITAYVVDWKDWPFSSICDDFGQAADPEPINNKADLIAFLTDPNRNKAGNVAVIMPEDFNLLNAVVLDEESAEKENKKHLVADSDGKNPGEEGYATTYETGYTPVSAGTEIAPAGWDPANYELKATLKLAGATITTNQRLFKSISVSGSMVNGTIVIADRGSTDGELECAVAQTNYGTVERVNVQAGETTRKATRAGLVTTNYGTIYCCTSQMPVYNAGGEQDVLIGGIAAESLFDTSVENATQPVIDQCNVNARVDGGTNVKGGGIAGKAEGKVTNNTYEYGITLSQDVSRFKNILYTKGPKDLAFSGNEWSTTAENFVVNDGTYQNGRPSTDCYNQVLDSQAELQTLITTSTYNNSTCRFRIADSFAVNGDTWELGIQNLATNDSRNLNCELDGNDKTITLTGSTNAKMLFSNIVGKLYDLTLELDKPIVATPNSEAETDEGKLPARAPLAYAVVGREAKISNIKVKSKEGAYVQSAASSGLVVWAYDGATIEDCKSDVEVRIALPEETGEQQTYFVGGLVNTAAWATILRCTYDRDKLETEEAHAGTGSNIYYGGIVGGTNTKGAYAPSLHISDCSSWLTWKKTEELPHAAWGGIIGYSKYQNTSSDLVTSMDGHCQGNWWAAPAGASAQGWASGMNEEKVIGKKNSVQPTRN